MKNTQLREKVDELFAQLKWGTESEDLVNEKDEVIGDLRTTLLSLFNSQIREVVKEIIGKPEKEGESMKFKIDEKIGLEIDYLKIRNQLRKEQRARLKEIKEVELNNDC